MWCDMQKISVKNLGKTYNNQCILKSISLDASSGDVLALVGSSGAGKSTLLKCISLLEKSDTGFMQINGQHVDFKNNNQNISSAKLSVGLVFQGFHLWPHMTVLNNLIKAPKLVLKESHSTAVTKAKTLLSTMGLTDKASAYPGALSGGQQQRIAIARALMMEPAVLLFDEPTSALDPESTIDIIKIIKSLAQKGVTMIIATHDIGFAQEIATHVAFLENGEIHEQGEANKLFYQPSTARFQEFLHSVC